MKEQLSATYKEPEKQAFETSAATHLHQSNRDMLSSAPLTQMSATGTTNMPTPLSPTLTMGPIQAKKGKAKQEQMERQQEVEALKEANLPSLFRADEFNLGGAEGADPLDVMKEKPWMRTFSMNDDNPDAETVDLLELIESISLISSGTKNAEILREAEVYEKLENKTPDAKNTLVKKITGELPKIYLNTRSAMSQDHKMRALNNDETKVKGNELMQGNANHMRDGSNLKGIMEVSKRMSVINNARGVLGDENMHADGSAGSMLTGVANFNERLNAMQALQRNEEMYLKYGLDGSKVSSRDKRRNKGYFEDLQKYQEMSQGGKGLYI